MNHTEQSSQSGPVGLCQRISGVPILEGTIDGNAHTLSLAAILTDRARFDDVLEKSPCGVYSLHKAADGPARLRCCVS